MCTRDWGVWGQASVEQPLSAIAGVAFWAVVLLHFTYSGSTKFRINSNVYALLYRIAGKFGGELNLAVWWSVFATAKLKPAKISYLRIYVWRSRTEPPN